jgi:hypothetical protein
LGLRSVVVRWGVVAAGVLMSAFGVAVRTVVVGAAVPVDTSSTDIGPV